MTHPVTPGRDEKACTKCGVVKALGEFSRNKIRPDGRNSWCLVCMRAYMSNYNKSAKGKEAQKRFKSQKGRNKALKPENIERWAAKTERESEGEYDY